MGVMAADDSMVSRGLWFGLPSILRPAGALSLQELLHIWSTAAVFRPFTKFLEELPVYPLAVVYQNW